MDQQGFTNVRGSTTNAVPQLYAAPVDLLYVGGVYSHAGSQQECEALLQCGPEPMKMAEAFKMEFLDYI